MATSATMSRAEAEAVVATMAQAIADEVGAFDPTIIITIINAIVSALQNCKKPSKQSDAKSLINEAATKHPNVCPMGLRGCFRGLVHSEDRNEYWQAIARYSRRHSDAVSAMMVAA